MEILISAFGLVNLGLLVSLFKRETPKPVNNGEQLTRIEEALRTLKKDELMLNEAFEGLNLKFKKLDSKCALINDKFISLPEQAWNTELVEAAHFFNSNRFGTVEEFLNEPLDWHRRVKTGSSISTQTMLTIAPHIPEYEPKNV